ncbi:MAG: hypothetical protein KDC82_00105 [Bacteroidetes bacterium]|nr:hypothetical protein [Bacteroidota bacterium]
MKKNLLLSIFMLSTLLFISSCAKDEDPKQEPTEETGTVTMNLNYVWGMNNSAFSLNTPLTHPMTGEVLTFETLKFYVSNIKFKSEEDGTWWSQEESYYLVDASLPNGSTLTIPGVPVAHYTEMSFTIGVDSARNVRGAQTGALSVANNMFWSWNSGYIMIKAEGTEASAGGFAYHLGGFSGPNSVVTELGADFSNSHLMVEKDQTTGMNFNVNPAKFWHNFPGGVAGTNSLMAPGPDAALMASEFVASIQFTGF